MSTTPTAGTALRDYQAAERRLARREARTGIRIHASVYAVVIPLLIAVNLIFVPQACSCGNGLRSVGRCACGRQPGGRGWAQL